jgi:hypothetical protein
VTQAREPARLPAAAPASGDNRPRLAADASTLAASVLHRSRAGNGNYVSVTGSPATVYVGGGERRGASVTS